MASRSAWKGPDLMFKHHLSFSSSLSISVCSDFKISSLLILDPRFMSSAFKRPINGDIDSCSCNGLTWIFTNVLPTSIICFAKSNCRARSSNSRFWEILSKSSETSVLADARRRARSLESGEGTTRNGVYSVSLLDAGLRRCGFAFPFGNNRLVGTSVVRC